MISNLEAPAQMSGVSVSRDGRSQLPPEIRSSAGRQRPSQKDLADKEKIIQEVQKKLCDAHTRPSVAMHTSLQERLDA
jgi:hypothetical protein